ncbi:hypothetical protein ACFUJ0_10185 [Streptomyces sp. NPDC057242]|uniref:P-loop NTPase n=1 Tax=unclassified Streptomyces TaxID=2593676 RepID=UPI00363F8229
MADLDPSAHFLCVGPLPASTNERGRALRAALDDLRQLHSAGKQLAGLFILGTGGELPGCGYQASREFVDTLLLECLSHASDSLPLVLATAGLGDLCTVPAGRRMLIRALTDMWDGLSPEFWRGDLVEDVARPLKAEVFRGFEEWQRRVRQDGPQAHAGLLPGEGALRLDLEGWPIGLVTVNTVFRMVSENADVDLAGCSVEQLDRVVGSDFKTWASENELTLLLAGRTGSLPDLSGIPSSVLAIAADGEAGGGWNIVPHDADRVHRLLRMDIRSDGSRVVENESGSSLALVASRGGGCRSAPAVVDVVSPQQDGDDTELIEDFYHQAATGRMVLALVSGPEIDDAVIGMDELNERLAQMVFGSVPSPLPSLAETWAAAREELPQRQLDRQLKALQCPLDVNPRAADRLLKSPWWRIYDFTGSDTLARAIACDPQLAESVAMINATQDGPGSKKNVVEVISMNGTVGDDTGVDFGSVTAQGSDPRSLWHRQFQAEVLIRPVLFMALSPDSPALWETLGLIDRMSGVEDFPGFIVTPDSTNANQARLRRAALRHIKETPFDFATQRLDPSHGSLVEGMRLLSQSHVGERKGTGIVRVATLVGEASRGGRAFLEGRDPSWGDVVDRVAADLSMVDALAEAAEPIQGGRAPIVLLKGSAGSGKTTALMQYAYRLHKAGENVGWVDRDASVSRRTIEAQALEQRIGAVFVDDVDIFGGQAATMLKTLNKSGENLVVAAIRTTRDSVLDATFEPKIVSADTPLNDDDLKNIIKTLKKHGLLGVLKQYRLPHQRLNAMRVICEQSLLAAMIKVVTGENFEAKVRSEFQQLNPNERAVYATVSLFESELVYKQRGIDEEDLLLIVSAGAAPNRQLREAVSRLVRMGLLVRTGDGRIRCRQRAIADSVVDSVLRNSVDQLSGVVRHLLVFYAARAKNIRDNDHPLRRAMIKLLSHALMRKLKLPVQAVREIYDAAHSSLQDDFHYWLQRGQFELEHGELRISRNHLATAKGCDGGERDPKVRTTSSAIDLASAAAAPRKVDLETSAVNAIRDLFSVTRELGSGAPHSYTILAREGTRWLESCTATLDSQTFLDIQRLILEVIQEGKRFCRNNHQFMAAAATYEPQLKKLLPGGPGVPL